MSGRADRNGQRDSFCGLVYIRMIIKVIKRSVKGYSKYFLKQKELLISMRRGIQEVGAARQEHASLPITVLCSI